MSAKILCDTSIGVEVPIDDSASQVWTVLRVLNWTKEYFEAREVDSPRLAAEVLLGHVLNCPRIELYTRHDYLPSSEQLAIFRELTKRAARGEPVAYLIGVKEFYSLQFKVTPEVLIPRPETELLVTEAVEHLQAIEPPGTMWDLCTGSGCVAVAVAKQVQSLEVLATDISPAAIVLAAENAHAHGLTGRVQCWVADLLSWCGELGARRQFDVITANPPYVAVGDEIAESVKYEPKSALYAGKDGLDCIRRIIADAPEFLKPGGVLIMEFGYSQAGLVRDQIVARGAFDEPRIIRDLNGIERSAVAMRPEAGH